MLLNTFFAMSFPMSSLEASRDRHTFNFYAVFNNPFTSQVGMYFAWTGFYTQSLFIPAITGILVFGYGMLGFGDDAISQDICRYGESCEVSSI